MNDHLLNNNDDNIFLNADDERPKHLFNLLIIILFKFFYIKNVLFFVKKLFIINVITFI